MGWIITFVILFLLAILPLGASVLYDAEGPRVRVVAGPLKIQVFPLKKKPKKQKSGKAKPKKEAKPKKKKEPAEGQLRIGFLVGKVAAAAAKAHAALGHGDDGHAVGGGDGITDDGVHIHHLTDLCNGIFPHVG